MSGLSTSPAALLRPGLLDGVAVLVCGPPSPVAPAAVSGSAGSSSASVSSPAEGVFAAAVGDACAALGASVSRWAPEPDPVGVGEAQAVDSSLTAGRSAEAAMRATDVLAVDGAGLFAEARAHGGGGHAALRACLDGAWDATHAVVNHAFLAGGPRDGHPGAAHGAGRIVYIAPRPDAGEHSDAARAGLENLARTLSIEWARYGVTTVAVAPGAHTSGEQAATLVAYLASPAGAYFSGCQLDLRGV
ncbi:MAG TPA: hypothetical protein VMU32_08585 [Solirubrobacteraceae bacterium]|nr:hypothetical protein [Solirubrobacteraceae bacterium]